MKIKTIFLFKIYILFFAIAGLSSVTFSQLRLEKIFIAQINFGSSILQLSSPLKVEAGLNLVSNLSRKFVLIPSGTIDSAINILKTNGIKQPTALEIGRMLECDKAFFISINRIANILRVDLASFNFADSSTKYGVGYGTIRYFQKEDHQPLIDPALLQALQRAVAVIYEDSLMFFNLDGSLRVKPAPTLVIGSINYIEDDSLKNWEIFRKKQISSYFAIEEIFEVAKSSPDFVVFDIESRDSAYELLNLYEPENYSIVSPLEVKALQMFDVEYYLSGEFFRLEDSPKIRLYLSKVENEGLVLIRQVEAEIIDDSLDEYGKILKKLTKKILNIKD